MSMAFVNSGDVTALFTFAEIWMRRVAYVQIISRSQHSVGLQVLYDIDITPIYQAVSSRISLRWS